MKDMVPNQIRRRICAVVPAAGRGTRLGADAPKVFVPILPNVTIWDALHGKLAQVADHIVLVLSPDGHTYLERHRPDFSPDAFDKTEIALQLTPLGMGDAIFGTSDMWRDYDDLLIVWGDQFNLSLQTLTACFDLHAVLEKPAVTLPVVRMPQPYVEYIFDSSNRLTNILQTREGDTCKPDGFSDIGAFLLSGGSALSEEWARYRAEGAPGTVTGEINFLPFLVHLSLTANWPVGRYITDDPSEAVGINTPEDLAFARRLFQENSSISKKSYE